MKIEIDLLSAKKLLEDSHFIDWDDIKLFNSQLNNLENADSKEKYIIDLLIKVRELESRSWDVESMRDAISGFNKIDIDRDGARALTNSIFHKIDSINKMLLGKFYKLPDTVVLQEVKTFEEMKND